MQALITNPQYLVKPVIADSQITLIDCSTPAVRSYAGYLGIPLVRNRGFCTISFVSEDTRWYIVFTTAEWECALEAGTTRVTAEPCVPIPPNGIAFVDAHGYEIHLIPEQEDGQA